MNEYAPDDLDDDEKELIGQNVYGRRRWSRALGGYTYDGVTLSKCQCPGSLLCKCGQKGKR